MQPARLGQDPLSQLLDEGRAVQQPEQQALSAPRAELPCKRSLDERSAAALRLAQIG